MTKFHNNGNSVLTEATNGTNNMNGHTNDVNLNGTANVVAEGSNGTEIFNDVESNDNSTINCEWLGLIQKDYLKVDIYEAYPGRTLINKFELFLADIAFN